MYVCITYLSHTSLYNLQACLRLQEVLFRYCRGGKTTNILLLMFGEMIFEERQYNAPTYFLLQACVYVWAGRCKCVYVFFFSLTRFSSHLCSRHVVFILADTKRQRRAHNTGNTKPQGDTCWMLQNWGKYSDCLE